jgi:DNA repair protein SbcC/Rad50
VFSLFMADEVDAAMDEERAEYTAQALRRLTTMVTQVILVTHKRPETDRTIALASE